MNLNQNYSAGTNYIPNHGYQVYQQHVSDQQYRQRVSGIVSISDPSSHEQISDRMDLWMWRDPAQVPPNGYLSMYLNGLGRKAISAGWSIAGFLPAYAIESFNDIIHNRSDQWIITIHNPTSEYRPVSFYLITHR
ncbi:hypothetical protein ACQGRJ_10935 [Bacillus atrophaeus]|uniref:hypothetical protein n=1 Tax=Bacillus atrophaeus TaxID=1452 RepID=UPI003CF1D76E